MRAQLYCILFLFLASMARSNADEYAEEHLAHMRASPVRCSLAHINGQVEYRHHMRPLMLDHLYAVSRVLYGYLSDEVSLAVRLMDNYMSRVQVYARHYELVGMTCLWLAEKYTRVGRAQIRSVAMVAVLADNQYTEREYVFMERHILKQLGWNLNGPSIFDAVQALLDREMDPLTTYIAWSAHYDVAFIDRHPMSTGELCIQIAGALRERRYQYANFLIPAHFRAVLMDNLRRDCMAATDPLLAGRNAVFALYTRGDLLS